MRVERLGIEEVELAPPVSCMTAWMPGRNSVAPEIAWSL
jgi:hypothetical protein